MATQFTLLGLPNELIVIVAKSLADPGDLGHFRLVNHKIYDITYNDFAARVSAQPWLMSEHSLRTLTTIGDNERLRQTIKHLNLDTHFLFVYEGARRQKKDNTHLEQWKLHSRRQAEFLSGGRDVAMLTLALSKLPRLKSVQVGQWCKTWEDFRFGYGGGTIAEECNSALSSIEMGSQYDFLMDFERELALETCGAIEWTFSVLFQALSVVQRPLDRLSAYVYKPCEFEKYQPGNEYFLYGLDPTRLP
ncbi:Uu.00g064950.m01.CDS01 [Anthostomella pinea]|uniref:Uu.00g064950.m01.CDS01 n=1 Tax=Anthostomella pinea TaxID=933095 RepID=A0AAI8VUA3_9PEZI|nr:Uu.00g064950.m01.CDS01 [Anthostomella pinea]